MKIYVVTISFPTIKENTTICFDNLQEAKKCFDYYKSVEHENSKQFTTIKEELLVNKWLIS